MKSELSRTLVTYRAGDMWTRKGVFVGTYGGWILLRVPTFDADEQEHDYEIVRVNKNQIVSVEQEAVRV